MKFYLVNQLGKKERGATLISLMIGLLISVVGILASLSLYKSLIIVAVDAKTSALHDGQLATTLMAIQLRVQNAGFGLEKNTVNIAILDDSGVKNIYWRSKLQGVIQCEGIRRSSNTIDGLQILQIDYLSSVGAACNETNALSSLTWTVASTLSSFRTDDPSTIDFSLLSEQCSPYGIDDKSNYVTLLLSGKTAAAENNSTIETTTIKLCLQNMSGV